MVLNSMIAGLVVATFCYCQFFALPYHEQGKFDFGCLILGVKSSSKVPI